MSHIAKYKTKIKNPNTSLLKQALQQVAKKYNLQLIENGTIVDYYGRQQQVQGFVLIGKQLPRGIAITKQGTILGDSYGYEQTFNQVKQAIQQYYTAFAVATAVQELYPEINIQESQNELIVTGVRQW